MIVNTITRDQLVKVAELALARTAEDLGELIPPEQRAAVMGAAQTAPRVSGNAIWWREATNGDPEYGCLVGWILKDDYISNEDPVFGSLGITYLRALTDVLGESAVYPSVIAVS